jgi:hypothetical protein
MPNKKLTKEEVKVAIAHLNDIQLFTMQELFHLDTHSDAVKFVHQDGSTNLFASMEIAIETGKQDEDLRQKVFSCTSKVMKSAQIDNSDYPASKEVNPGELDDIEQLLTDLQSCNFKGELTDYLELDRFDVGPVLSKYCGYCLNTALTQSFPNATSYYLTYSTPDYPYVFGMITVSENGTMGCRFIEGTHQYFENLEYDLDDIIDTLVAEAQ